MSDQSAFNMKETLTENKLLGLWRMMGGFRWLYIWATISVGVAAAGRTFSAYLIGYFVDDVLVQPEQHNLIPWVAVAFVGLALGQGIFTYLGGRWSAQTAEGIARRLRNYLYDHMQRLNFTYHDRMQTGDLLARSTSDVDTIRKLYADQLIGIGRIGSLFVISFVGLWYLDVGLALISVVIIPVVIGLSLYFFRIMEKAYERYQEQESRLSNQLQENLSGVRVVKAFARQEYETDRFETENKAKFQRGAEVVQLHATFWPLTDILCGIQMIVGFYIGARMAIAGDITVGMYLAYATLVIQLIWPIRNLGRLVAEMSTGLVSLERIQQIVRQEREALDTGSAQSAGRLRGELEFRNLNFTYEVPPKGVYTSKESALAGIHAAAAADGFQPEAVLHDINLHVKPGQVVGILGATGSGKTTLMNLLPRFYEYKEGQILLDGVDLREYPRGYLRQQMGIVQQEPFLFSATIRENITYGLSREVTDEEVYAAARIAAVHDVILGFPNGYETRVGERGVTLSGGQKQRVTVARTLLKDPSILILDDATSSVDTETDAAIRAALQELMRDRTTFIIAHRVQSLMDADIIIVMDEGRIVQRGTHADLVEQPGIYQRVFDLQARIEAELEKEIADAVERADRKLAQRNGNPAGDKTHV